MAIAIESATSQGSGAYPLSLALISPDQLRLSEDMSPHCLFELGLGRLMEIGEHCIQRIELVEIAVLPYRWAGATVSRPFPVIDTFEDS